MVITATELKENLGKYLFASQNEDIYIKKNGKVIVKLVSVEKDNIYYLNEFSGAIKNVPSYTADDVKEMRLKDKCVY